MTLRQFILRGLVTGCSLTACHLACALASVDTNISDPVVHDVNQSGAVEAGVDIARGAASAIAYADLDTGVLRAAAVGSGDPSQRLGTYASTATADFFDDVTFASGSSGTAFLDWEFRGSLSAASLNAGSTAYMGVAVTDPSSAAVTDHVYLTTFAGLCATGDADCVVGESIDRIGAVAFDIVPGRYSFSSVLQVVAENGAAADFSHTGFLALRLPAGTRYTSTSGTFLVDAAPIVIAAVPEPSLSALLGVGLAVLARQASRSSRRQRH